MLGLQLSLSNTDKYFQRGSNRTEEQASVAFQILQAYSCMGFGCCFSFFAVFLKAVVHFGNYIVTGKLSVLGKYCYCLSRKDLSSFYSFICLFHSYGKNQICWE